MSPQQANTVVLASAGITAVTVLAQAEGEEETFRALWALGLLALLLALLADFVPQVAGPFAVLIAVAAVARNPGALGRRLGFGPSGAGPAPENFVPAPPRSGR